mmetsp:Transcript_42092/g.112245  ORF Transcript_42092/g.112245 Transcript_42092/m.112245 type:complete len:179 (+) Transcript_42092:608-1144(+)
MLNEICVWSTVRHPSIVTFLGCYLDDPEQPLVVMEYMEGGTLQSHLEEVGRMDTDVVVIQALQIARGLFSLHNHNPKIIHRDLKPSNLLYSNLQKNDLKIADFGLSKMLIEKRGQDHRNMTGGTGSCRYMAPENYWYQVSLQLHALPRIPTMQYPRCDTHDTHDAHDARSRPPHHPYP